MSTRLFVSDRLSNGASIVLHGEQARYLGRVLRARVGDVVHPFNGDDGEWSATIQSVSKAGIELLIGERRETNVESPLRVHLVQGVSRGERMDFVVQKATELGVKRISPVLTDYGVVKLSAARAERRREHWQRVAENACEQSGRIRPPLIDPPEALNRWLGGGSATDSTQLMLVPGAGMPFGAIAPPAAKLCLLVGPEGGLSDRECDDAAAAGFTGVSLGPRILRTETAAVAALTAAQIHWGDLA